MRKFYLLVCFVAVITPLLYGKSVPFQGFLDYFDEILTIFSVAYISINFNKLHPNERKVLFFLGVLLFSGLCGTFYNRFQTGLFPIILNIIGWSKFICVFVFSNHIGERLTERSKKYIISRMDVFFKFFVLFAFLFGVINLFVNVGMSNEHRFGFRCFSFVYNKAQTLSNSFYIVFFFLLLGLRNASSKKQEWVSKCVLIMALVTWCFTLRSRAFVFIILFSFLFVWMVLLKRKFKLNIITIALIGLCSLFVAAEKMENTFENDAHPRAVLLQHGFVTMQDFFPIGGGLGTYGTDVACRYYSQLYYKYGFHKMWKLNPWDYTYAHDSFWPAVMGEGGVIGVVAMLFALFFLGKEMLRVYSDNPINRMMCLFLIICHVMASIPTSVFFQSRAVYLVFLLPLARQSCETLKCKLK